ncbi:MAG: hypothetical protein AB1491_00770 [Thermodesulfobacteriota bacterium]
MINLVGYNLFWYSLGGDLFGGDVQVSYWGEPSSFLLNESLIKNPGAFYREILAGEKSDPKTSAAAFVYARLTPAGRRALKALAADPALKREQNIFFLEANRALIDPPLDWPAALLKQGGLPPPVQGKMATPKRNLLVLAKLFPRHFGNYKPVWEFYQLWQTLPETVISSFTLRTPLRYTPITNIYTTFMGAYLFDSPRRIPVAVLLMGFLYACLGTGVFLLAARLIGPWPWALVAAVLYQSAMATIVSVYTLFSLPYLLVTIFMVTALYAYLQYKDSGKWVWLAAYLLLGVLGSWTREFPAAVPFIVGAAEILTYQGRRSLITLAASALLSAHCLYPAFLPWLVGLNQGRVFGLLAMGKTQFHTVAIPNWDLSGFVYVQFPPVLWLLTVMAILLSIWRWQGTAEGTRNASLSWWAGLLLRMVPASEKARQVLKILAIWLTGAVTLAFIYVFYVGNAGLQHFMYLRWGPAFLLFPVMVALASLRFQVLAPVYFLALLLGVMRVRVAEIHLTFLLPPLAIMLTQWVRELFLMLKENRDIWPRRLALTAVALLFGIGLADQLLNLPATSLIQKELVKKNQEMGLWLKNHLPKHSILIANFFYYTDLYYYSDRHFDPYESVENNPFGPAKVIFTDNQMENLLKRNEGIRPVFLMEAEHPYLSGYQNYHSHKWVRNPPGKLEKVAGFSLRQSYYYADPLKFFTPRYWISFPGYMDWFIDYWWDNSSSFFRREIYCDYQLYRLKI